MDSTTEARTTIVAEYVLLEAFNRARMLAGHDYGAGQRWKELKRRERELERIGVDHWKLEEPAAWNTPEFRAAFEAVGRPRIARIEGEPYRRRTPATARTLQVWRRFERRVGAAWTEHDERRIRELREQRVLSLDEQAELRELRRREGREVFARRREAAR
jgi:hypothetical protein